MLFKKFIYVLKQESVLTSTKGVIPRVFHAIPAKAGIHGQKIGRGGKVRQRRGKHYFT